VWPRATRLRLILILVKQRFSAALELGVAWDSAAAVAQGLKPTAERQQFAGLKACSTLFGKSCRRLMTDD
jgi:hypothetical protein